MTADSTPFGRQRAGRRVFDSATSFPFGRQRVSCRVLCVEAGVRRGVTVAYQAEGSTVLQVSHMLRPTQSHFDVTSLHENTNYNVCIWLFNNLTTGRAAIAETMPHTTHECIQVRT